MIRTQIIVAVVVAFNLAMVGGCSIRSADERTFPMLATTNDNECGDKHSVLLYELPDRNGKVHGRALPKRVPPGTYSIGVGCAWVFDPALNRCVDVRKVPAASMPAYPLVLKANVDYTFSCVQRAANASGDHEQVISIGATRLTVDATYDLRLRQSTRPQVIK